MPRRLAAIILIAAALVALVSASAPPALAQEDKALTDLKALFEKDPAAGFVEAERLFEKSRAEGDLAGMLRMIAAARDRAVYCMYATPCLAMAEAALPVAMARGDWAAVGDIRWAQAAGVGVLGGLRLEVVGRSASESYAKAGQEPAGFTAWRESWAAELTVARTNRTQAAAAATALPGELREVADDLLQTIERADDSRAADLMVDLVRMATNTPAAVRSAVANVICWRMFLPGSERILPDLRRWIVDAEKEENEHWASANIANSVMAGCAVGWSGREDVFLQTYNWCLQTLRRSGIPTDLGGALGLQIKSVRLSQPERVDEMIRMVLDLPVPPDYEPARWSMAAYLIHSSMPADLRRRMVQEQLGYIDWDLRSGQSEVGDYWRGFSTGWIEAKAPESERTTWCLETAYQILDYAPNFPTAASRSQAATEAAAYFAKAGRADLASQSQQLAKSFAANDPKLRLQVVLAAAQSTAAAGKWEELIKGLEPVMVGLAPSGAAVQAALLLQQAQ
ncbi:MAG: hypothetical protein ABFE08_04220, partial [Armatimonadia bacterium]